MSNAALSCLHHPGRPQKPRRTGLTIATDIGTPLDIVRGVLDVAAETIDEVKFIDHVGLMTRFAATELCERAALYHRYDVKFVPGGLAYQIAVVQDKVENFLKALVDSGFDGVEISEDVMRAIPEAVKAKHIERARALGLKVRTELGKKAPGEKATFSAEELIRLGKRDLELGSSMVVLQQAEIRIMLKTKPSDLKQIRDGIGPEHVIFEAGAETPSLDLAAELIRLLGPDVNLENIRVESHRAVRTIEAARLGLSRMVKFSFFTGSAK